MLIVKKLCAYASTLLILSLVPGAVAQAESGYETPSVYPYTITLGQYITLYNEPNCSPGIGEPSVTFYASTTPDTVGGTIANLGYGDNSTTWTPTASGTYYIAEYVSANGANCSGETEPSFVTVTVNP